MEEVIVERMNVKEIKAELLVDVSSQGKGLGKLKIKIDVD